jgi:precorrin isomerase
MNQIITSIQKKAQNDLMNDAYSHLKARVVHYVADVKLADYISVAGSSLQEIHQQIVNPYLISK